MTKTGDARGQMYPFFLRYGSAVFPQHTPLDVKLDLSSIVQVSRVHVDVDAVAVELLSLLDQRATSAPGSICT